MKNSTLTILSLLSFSSRKTEGFVVELIPQRTAPCRTMRKCSIATIPRSYSQIQSSLFATEAETETIEEDDGWGTSDADVSTARTAETATKSSSSARELAALRTQMAEKKNPPSRDINSTNSNNEPERDLFIPIFAIVSLAGLFGAYGYEILRLNARGELYLPWNQ